MTATKPEFILVLEDVNKTFEGFKAISNLNFYMDQGELRVIIGPNGAGKSTGRMGAFIWRNPRV